MSWMAGKGFCLVEDSRDVLGVRGGEEGCGMLCECGCYRIWLCAGHIGNAGWIDVLGKELAGMQSRLARASYHTRNLAHEVL